MNIIFNLASRGRPERFAETVDSIMANLSPYPAYDIFATLDDDDRTLCEYCMDSFLPGKSKSKIDAINRNCEFLRQREDWGILVNISDDQVIVQPNFDEIIKTLARESGKGFLHFRDTNHNPPDALCTMSIMTRDYFLRDGYIYHPSYKSVWCDNEAQEVAKMRGEYVFSDTVIFDHRHPAYGKAQMDSQYKKTEAQSVHHADHQNYLRRKKQGFPK